MPKPHFKRVTILLPDEIHGDLADMAAESRTTKTHVLRRALMTFIYARKRNGSVQIKTGNKVETVAPW